MSNKKKLSFFEKFKQLKPLQPTSRGEKFDLDAGLLSLHEHLKIAMIIEFSTIPPYLCGMYSIKNGDNTKPNYQDTYGDNAEAIYTIRSVVMEEMLHFTLVGNILNAVGGKTAINEEDFVPEYPTGFPDGDGSFTINLAKFSPDSVATFVRIEEPTPPCEDPAFDNYATIGQFYAALLALLKKLEKEAQAQGSTIFTGDSTLQIDRNFYYGSGGAIISVTDLQSAEDAIEIILEQGEGTETNMWETVEGGHRELAHYFKFKELYHQQRYAPTQTDPHEDPKGEKMYLKYDQVLNMKNNPRTEDFVSRDLQILSTEFNISFRELLDDLQAAFNGTPKRLIQGVANMYKMKYKAVELMRNPIPGQNVNAGPTFEFLSDEDIVQIKEELGMNTTIA